MKNVLDKYYHNMMPYFLNHHITNIYPYIIYPIFLWVLWSSTASRGSENAPWLCFSSGASTKASSPARGTRRLAKLCICREPRTSGWNRRFNGDRHGNKAPGDLLQFAMENGWKWSIKIGFTGFALQQTNSLLWKITIGKSTISMGHFQ